MSDTMKVFLACAIGAFIGTVVSLEVNRYFWWFGLIVGGFVGYISYEFKKVVLAIPTVWRKARGWQPDRKWWQEYCRCIFGTIGLAYALVTPVLGFILWPYLLTQELGLPEKINTLILCFGTVALTGTYFGAIFPLGFATEEMFENTPHLNPFRFYFWLLPKWTLKGTRWLLRNSPSFINEMNEMTIAIAIGISSTAQFAVRFGRILFREIHSDLRMLCGLDAAIGTVIGYFVGSAVIGAIAGGLWGVLNFEILSIRVLKLVPTEKSLFR